MTTKDSMMTCAAPDSELLRPKVVTPDMLEDMHAWSQRLLVALARGRPIGRDPAYSELKDKAMSHFPLREDQLDVIAFLKPSLNKSQKPPLLRFGWIVREEEIIAMAKKKNIGPITSEDYRFPGEPGYPEGQEPDEYGGTTVTTTEYHPMHAGGSLLRKAKEDLDLKAFPIQFTLTYVEHSLFNSSGSWFISLYTTMDTLPGRRMAALSAERATMLSDRPEFKHAVEKLQKWLELDDREPGWCVCACANNWISWYEWQRRGQSHC